MYSRLHHESGRFISRKLRDRVDSHTPDCYEALVAGENTYRSPVLDRTYAMMLLDNQWFD